MIDYDALAKAFRDPAGIFSFEAEDYPLVVEFIAMQWRADAENTADSEADDTQAELAQRWLHGPLVQPLKPYDFRGGDASIGG